MARTTDKVAHERPFGGGRPLVLRPASRAHRTGTGGRRRNATTCLDGRVLSYTERHSKDDPRLGEPLCLDCYDYTASVLFNALAPLLWKRFADSVRRHLAKAGGLALKDLRHHLTLSNDITTRVHRQSTR